MLQYYSLKTFCVGGTVKQEGPGELDLVGYKYESYFTNTTAINEPDPRSEHTVMSAD